MIRTLLFFLDTSPVNKGRFWGFERPSPSWLFFLVRADRSGATTTGAKINGS